jgi:hypothetical protein
MREDKGRELAARSFSLNFAKITFDYFPQAAGGQAAAPIEFNFDLRENRT